MTPNATNRTRREFIKTAASFAVGAGASWMFPVKRSYADTASGQRRPSILLFLPDQHRHDWIGSNPRVPVRTPNLDGLAARGVLFRNALTPSPLCAPMRACLAAGKEYDRCRVPGNGTDYPVEQTTFYGLLRESGYHVAGCGKFDLHKASPSWGLDGKHLLGEWGFSDGIDNAGKWDAIHGGSKEPKDPYMAFLEKRGLREIHIADFRKRRDKAATHATPLPEDAYCDNWIAGNGLELLERFPKEKPWFLQVNLAGPHNPWDVTERMAELYRDVIFPQPNRSTQLTPEIHNAIRRNYAAMIENIDRLLGTYVEELRRRGELNNTIIVFSSDHGEMLGDHDRWGKSLPYQPSVGVPLVVAGPGVRPGHVCDEPVSAMDLTATFLDYAKLPVPGDMDSRSLCALLVGGTDKHRNYVLSGLGRWRLVFDGRYKMMRGFGPGGARKGTTAEAKPAPQILFDLHKDPGETDDLAASHPDVVERLSNILDKETTIVTDRRTPETPKRTAGAIITHERDGVVEVFLTRRNVNPYKGRWCFPGGHVDPGESAEQTVVREVKEETGLDFQGTFFRGFDENIPDMRVNNVVSMFEGTVSGTLQFDPREVAEARWFPLTEAHSLDLAFQHNEVLKVWEEARAGRTE